MTARAPRAAALAAAVALAVPALALTERAAAAGSPGDGAPRPRAVVLISLDTLRADGVSFNGYARRTTPFLDRWAEEGVVFDRAYSTSSWTPPAMASLMTGLEPRSHGVTAGFVQSTADGVEIEQRPLSAELTTLAESFRAAGFRTAGAAANRHLAADLGFAQGFEGYYEEADFLRGGELYGRVAGILRGLFGAPWRRAWKRQPTFLWVHYFDPHDPYFANPPWIDRFAPDYRDRPERYPAGLPMQEIERRYPLYRPELAEVVRPLYDSEVAYMDRQIEHLARSLRLDDPDVLVVVVADHGEEIFDHGDLGHAIGLHEELVRVPLVVRWPRAIPGGGRSDAPVSLVDLYPTLAELVGFEVPEAVQGESFADLLLGGAQEAGSGPAGGAPGEERALRFSLDPPKGTYLGVRRGRWKLIWHYVSGDVQLYDLAEDPGELHDLAGEEPVRAERMRSELEAWWQGLPEPPPAETGRLVDEALREQLEALGYLDPGG